MEVLSITNTREFLLPDDLCSTTMVGKLQVPTKSMVSSLDKSNFRYEARLYYGITIREVYNGVSCDFVLGTLLTEDSFPYFLLDLKSLTSPSPHLDRLSGNTELVVSGAPEDIISNYSPYVSPKVLHYLLLINTAMRNLEK